MFFFTMKREIDVRPILPGGYGTEDEADAARAEQLVLFPEAEFSAVLEEGEDYRNHYPNVRARVANADGSEDLVWSDGVRTPLT
jgi:hypothetical protein